MPASNVIVLGSINVDLVVKSTRLPRPGETVIGGEFYRAAGGKGANQAVAAARIDDAPVAFIAAVGDDFFGQESLSQLRRENMNCDTIRGIVGEPTGVAAILVDENGENCISVASGANALLSPDDVLSVSEEAFRDARVFLACLESPLETVVAGLRRARSARLLAILNPAPALVEIAEREILELIDVITPNESEAQALTGVAISTVEDGLRAARKLQAAGCERVVLTRGRGVCSRLMASRQPSCQLSKCTQSTPLLPAMPSTEPWPWHSHTKHHYQKRAGEPALLQRFPSRGAVPSPHFPRGTKSTRFFRSDWPERRDSV